MNSDRGVTLIEVAIALGVIGILVLGLNGVYAFVQSSSVRMSEREICNTRLQFALSELELDRTIAAQRFLPRRESRTAPVPPAAEQDSGVQMEHRWPQNADYRISFPTVTPFIKNSYLQYGPVNTLLAIYNSDPDLYCTNPEGGEYVAPDNLFAALTRGDQPIGSFRLRIQPYNIISGASAPNDFNCPPSPLFVRPRGVENVAPGAASAGEEFMFPDNSRSDLGLHLTLTFSANDHSSASSCRLEKHFSHLPDSTLPPAPEVSLVTNTTPKPVCSTDATNTLVIQVRENAVPKRGSLLLCRDQSLSLAPVCVPTGHPPLGPAGILGSQDWWPCDVATACGIQATDVALNWVGADSNVGEFTLTYEDLPINCAVNLEVVAVDPAGNLSPVTSFMTTISPPPVDGTCGCGGP